MNLVVWAAFAASIVGVSSVASALGLTGKGQQLAASSAPHYRAQSCKPPEQKNDLLLGVLAICAVYFGLLGRTMFSGLSFGLAVATKGTAYLFGPALLAVLICISWHKDKTVSLVRKYVVYPCGRTPLQRAAILPKYAVERFAFGL